MGQTLYVLSGVGRLQFEGENVEELRPRGTGIIPPNTRHWHGASPDRFFFHLAMAEVDDDGEGTEWFEHVTDQVYSCAPDFCA